MTTNTTDAEKFGAHVLALYDRYGNVAAQMGLQNALNARCGEPPDDDRMKAFMASTSDADLNEVDRYIEARLKRARSALRVKAWQFEIAQFRKDRRAFK